MSLAEEVQMILEAALQEAERPTFEDRIGSRPEEYLQALSGSVDGLKQVVVRLAQEIDTLNGAEHGPRLIIDNRDLR